MTEELPSKSKLPVRHYEDRPVGCPPDSDPAAMTQEEKEAHRNTVERLAELVEKAGKGDKKPLPEIRKKLTVAAVAIIYFLLVVWAAYLVLPD